jgi:hypothetical protein
MTLLHLLLHLPPHLRLHLLLHLLPHLLLHLLLQLLSLLLHLLPLSLLPLRQLLSLPLLQAQVDLKGISNLLLRASTRQTGCPGSVQLVVLRLYICPV